MCSNNHDILGQASWLHSCSLQKPKQSPDRYHHTGASASQACDSHSSTAHISSCGLRSHLSTHPSTKGQLNSPAAILWQNWTTDELCMEFTLCTINRQTTVISHWKATIFFVLRRALGHKVTRVLQGNGLQHFDYSFLLLYNFPCFHLSTARHPWPSTVNS